MKIELHSIKIRDIVSGYEERPNEGGVFGYGGKLNIRPPYQREFVYDEVKRNAVIDTIVKGFPLNVMYWCKNDDGTFEVLDGQQRTISFCQYADGVFSVNNRAFHNLTGTERQQILDYDCMIYFCEGNDREKLDWFKIINIAGEKLTNQELRNAVYTGPWLADAKLKFSKSNCAAYLHGKDYVSGSPIRQELLETAIDWISDGKIEAYMSGHQHTPNANELFLYFRSVIDWVKNTFTTYRKEMKGLPWGNFYNRFKAETFDTAELERKIAGLMADDDVTNKKGIYAYILTHDEKFLHIRAFTPSEKRTVYEKQKGVCTRCKQKFAIEEMEADHIVPWSRGGHTSPDNCQMLCRKCNNDKRDK